MSAWPAIALVLTFEVLTVMIRRAAARPGLAAPGVTGHDLEVARFREYLERGKVPGIKAIKTELRVGQPKAREVRERLRDVLSVDG